MPKQEVLFEQESAGRRIELLKSYYQNYAREAFKNMDEDALQGLWNILKPEDIYDPAGLPTPREPEERAAFLWDELVEQAREDWQTHSFFIVNEMEGSRTESLWVSPDWPSAEAFARGLLLRSDE